MRSENRQLQARLKNVFFIENEVGSGEEGSRSCRSPEGGTRESDTCRQEVGLNQQVGRGELQVEDRRLLSQAGGRATEERQGQLDRRSWKPQGQEGRIRVLSGAACCEVGLEA